MRQRSDLTPTGFSKPFACCGHYNFCQMGKGICVYKDTDPETMQNCRAYINNQRLPKEEKYQLSLF